MNFFKAQDQAKSKTRQLTFLFVAALISLLLMANLLVAVMLSFENPQSNFTQTIMQTPPQIWLFISLGVGGVVAVASLFKYLTLRGGGKAVAESLGGILIHQNTRNPQERQLLNVVEEMAIAAGLSVPPVYLIRENSINAFAAGFSPNDAVIGINQGTLDLLNREELQGVVAHEFSHILNGDMRINLRLMALLHGILFLGIIGGGFLRGSMFSRSKDRGGVIALGIGLLIIGYGGTFFGNMIKAAVSRQREFLADAAAVQFTRSNKGIANALKKIGGHSVGSTIENTQAEQSSHMFFGAIKPFAANLMSTHPPLEKRIQALDPSWNGKFEDTGSQPRQSGNAQSSALASGFSGSTTTSAPEMPASQSELLESIGSANLAQAQVLIHNADAGLLSAAHDTFEARGLVYAMLIAVDADVAQKQLEYVDANAEAGVPNHVHRLLPAVMNADQEQKLTLLEMAVASLKELSARQYERFTGITNQLIVADQQVDIFEWVLHRILTKELYGHFVAPSRSSGNIRSLKRLSPELHLLLSVIAAAGIADPQTQSSAFDAGWNLLPTNKTKTFTTV
ncbi:M48 family metallopeptidase, partial [Pseudomonadales bacterium]|nr:M48 family metallopeptidase [Pseudomonadales bacterium]